MEMLKPSQSHTVGVTVKPYTGNIAQELQFLTGEKKKTKPILRLGSPWQPSNKCNNNTLSVWWLEDDTFAGNQPN